MNSRYIYLIILFLCSAASAQTTKSTDDNEYLSLTDLIQQIESSYPDVVKFNDKVLALRAKADGAKAWMPPAFSAGINRFPYSLKGMQEMSPMNQAGLMFSFDQMIVNPAKLNIKKNLYNSLTSVEEEKADWTKNELRNIARKYYYQRCIAEQRLKVIFESKDILNLFINTAENRYAYNEAGLANIYKARAKLQEIGNMRLMEEARIAESIIGINTLLDRNINTSFSIDTTIALASYAPILLSDTFERSDIAVMQHMVRSMQLEKKYMASQSRPDFGIKVQHMQMFGMQEQFSIMGMITLPIVPWSSGMYKSDVKAMQYEINAAEKEIEGMQLMAIRMAAEKLNMLNYSRKQIINYDSTIIPAFEKNLEANLLAFRQNTGDFFVLLDAWEMLLMKKMERLDLLNNAFMIQSDYEYQMEIK